MWSSAWRSESRNQGQGRGGMGRDCAAGVGSSNWGQIIQERACGSQSSEQEEGWSCNHENWASPHIAGLTVHFLHLEVIFHSIFHAGITLHHPKTPDLLPFYHYSDAYNISMHLFANNWTTAMWILLHYLLEKDIKWYPHSVYSMPPLTLGWVLCI